MTDAERIDALEQALGMPRLAASRLSKAEWEAKAPWPSNASGDYNIADWMRLNTNIVADQRVQLDAQAAQITALAAKVDSLAASNAALAAKVAALPTTSGGTTVAPNTPTLVTSALGNGHCYHDPAYPSSASHVIFAGGHDSGFRILYNHRNAWDGQPSHSKTNLPQLRVDFEQDGVLSLNYQKRLDVAAGAYDALGGKDIVVRPGGQQSEGGPRGKYAMIGSGLVGRGIEFGVAGAIPNVVSGKIRIDPDNPDAVSVVVGGSYRRVKVRADGTLYAE